MSKPEINCFVGTDMQGDACIYVKRGECDGNGDGYLSGDELEGIAEALQSRLNAKPKTARRKADPKFINRRQRVKVTRALLEDAKDAVDSAVYNLDFFETDAALQRDCEKVSDRLSAALGGAR